MKRHTGSYRIPHIEDATPVVKKIDLYMETRNSHRQIGYCSKHNPERKQS